MDPFTDNRDDSIRHLGERGLIDEIRRCLGTASPPAPHGIGDDTAVLPLKHCAHNLITVDSILFGRHFDASVAPEEAGEYLLKRNLSDIAAMGGTPATAVLGLFLPSNLSLEWLRRFYRGLKNTARCWNIFIVGGDLCESVGTLGGHLTLLGHAIRPVTRHGAAAGDLICVTGELGGSLSSGRYLRFVPRVREGRWLADQPSCKSMIDITDGLVADLHALNPKGCLPSINRSHLPIHHDVQSRAKSRNEAEHRALSDGEDYELLFSLAVGTDFYAFRDAWEERFSIPVTKIGSFVSTDNRARTVRNTLVNEVSGKVEIIAEGYEHFADT